MKHVNSDAIREYLHGVTNIWHDSLSSEEGPIPTKTPVKEADKIAATLLLLGCEKDPDGDVYLRSNNRRCTIVTGVYNGLRNIYQLYNGM